MLGHQAFFGPKPIVVLVLCILGIYALTGNRLCAQIVTPEVQQGTPINTSDDLHGVESINTMGLGLHIEIPLLSIREHDRTLTWKYVYNSPTYKAYYYAQPTSDNSNAGNFAIQAPGSQFKDSESDNWNIVSPLDWQLLWDTVSSDASGNPLGCDGTGRRDILDYPTTYVHYVNFRLVDPGGAAHPLAMDAYYYTKLGYSEDGIAITCPNTPGLILSSPTLDSSKAFVDMQQNAFWLDDGTKFNLQPPPPAVPVGGGQSDPGPFRYGSGGANVMSVEDRNGNYLRTQGNSLFTDSFGRGLSLGSNSTATTKYYQYIDSNGVSQQIAVNLIRVPVSTNDCDLTTGGTYPCVEYTDDSTSGFQLPSSIVLPDHSTYSFTYNQPGTHAELSSMTLPTGAVISYTYQRIAGPIATPRKGATDFRYAISSRTEHLGARVNPWLYSLHNYIDDSYFDTWVQDPLGNCTEHHYAALTSGDSPLEQAVVTRQGCGPNGRILKTVQNTYTGDGGGFFGPTYWNPRPTQSVTTFANGQASKMQTDYDSYIWGGVSTSWLNPTEVREYDFNTNTPTRWTDYSYLYKVGSSSHQASDYASRNIHNAIVKQTITASSGSQRSITYDYDTNSVASSGAASRDGSYGSWANANTKTVKDEVSGKSYQSQYWYEDTGSIVHIQDPRGNSTYYSYSDNWNDASCSAPMQHTNLYLTQVTNALGHRSSYTLNSCTGRLASLTDPNGIISYFTYDSLNRTTLAKRAASTRAESWTAYSYPDANHVMVKQDKYVKEDGVLTSSTTYDELGRVVNQTRSDTSSIDWTYDDVGRVHSISNPYYVSSGQTNQTTSFLYDALDRKIIETESDGHIQQWCYDGMASAGEGGCAAQGATQINATWVDYTNENGGHWQRSNDAFGNLAKLLEPDSTGVPTLESDYVYDGFGNLTSINQHGVAGEYPRNRSFTYDSFSRLLTANNLETGVVCYGLWNRGSCIDGYDGNDNLQYKMDARGVTANYSYDALNRLVSKTYTNDASGALASCHQYDTLDGSASEANLIGRPTVEWTQKLAPGASCPSMKPAAPMTSRTLSAYDAMGRISSETQCVGSSCTKDYSSSPTYTYDLAGNLTLYGNLIGTAQFTNAYDAAARLSSVTDTWTGAAQVAPLYPASLFSSPSYTPFGALSAATYGTGLSLARTYDSRLRVTGEIGTGTIGSGPAAPGKAVISITGGVQAK